MHPSTIKHHATFERSLPIGFDGVFDWSWTQGHLGQGKITPMDFDGVRLGRFVGDWYDFANSNPARQNTSSFWTSKNF